MTTVIVGGRVHLQHLVCPCLPIFSRLNGWSMIGHREPWVRWIDV